MAEADNHNHNHNSSPHDALFLVLPYLPLFDLLSVSRVCTSLRHAVATDLLAWLQILVDRPLHLRISDDVLLEVASKARGRLQSLSLINCIRITDDALFRVAAQNPFITKLHVPGCTGLTPAGVITAAKILAKDGRGLKSIRINGIYGLQKEDLAALCDLIDWNQAPQENTIKILYHEYLKTSTLSRNHAIDVDMCPKCNDVRMVFDCPKVQCRKQQQQQEVSKCRGCETCITRCVECGVCVNVLEELEEAACEDTLCLECWLSLPKCSFCNRPYCNLHAGQQQSLIGSTGFLCAACHTNFV